MSSCLKPSVRDDMGFFLLLRLMELTACTRLCSIMRPNFPYGPFSSCQYDSNVMLGPADNVGVVVRFCERKFSKEADMAYGAFCIRANVCCSDELLAWSVKSTRWLPMTNLTFIRFEIKAGNWTCLLTYACPSLRFFEA